MNPIITLRKYTSRMLVIAMLLISELGYSQPEYSFSGGSLISGTALQVGARYRYNNVRPGIDAILEITAKSPGIGLTELDGSSGYPATIQPTITANAWTNGYVEMTITFKVGGTNTDMQQPELAVTAFDVDGVINHDGQGNNLHEFDQFNLGGGYANYNTVASQLSVAGPDGSNWWTGTNVTGIDYPGRDTSAQQVMFSVINVNVTVARIRVGINNQTANSASRLRAVYFKKFIYNNALLAFNTIPRVTRDKKTVTESSFNVYPTNLQSAATIAVNAEENGTAMFELVDYAGRVLHKQMLTVNKGTNNIPFSVSSVSTGNYVAVLKMNGEVYNKKVVKQF